MPQIGIFFGTDTGTTRLIAKKIAKKAGDTAAKPLNVNRITPDEMLAFDSMILGTPSYGDGQLPGLTAGKQGESWEEFLPRIADADLSGKTIALYGLGNQEKHGEHFAGGLGHLYRFFIDHGATIVGYWPINGYDFKYSEAVVDGQFAGLVIDQNCQSMLTDERLDAWLALVLPQLSA